MTVKVSDSNLSTIKRTKSKRRYVSVERYGYTNDYSVIKNFYDVVIVGRGKMPRMLGIAIIHETTRWPDSYSICTVTAE